MPKDMIGPIARALVGVPLHRQGVLLDVVNRLSSTSSDGDGWCSRFGAVLKEELQPKVPQPSSILKFVNEVVVSATVGKFVASEVLGCDITPNALVKISGFGSNFTDWFLSGNGKIEEPITRQVLRSMKLLKSSVDGPIIAELGGEAEAETTLTELYALMKLQANGQKGALLNNGWWNIFYIKDQTGVLRAVDVGWSGDGWSVGASSVGGPRVWSGGGQVFSRNSVLEPSDT